MLNMLRAGQGLMLIVAALLTIGVIMVSSAGLSVQTAATPGIVLGRPAVFACLAIVMMLIGSRLPIDRLQRAGAALVPWIIGVTVVLLLAVHLPVIGREVNGARRWITFGFIGFQPSEVAKWAVVFVLACLVSRRAAVMGRFGRGFVIPMMLVAVVCALIVSEDLGTAVLIGTVGIAMLIAGGARLRHVVLPAPIAVGGFIAALLASPYRLDRLRAFVDPYQDPQGIGYHVIQSMAAVTGGGLAGRGLGNSVQKFGYLPEDTTDFIFAVICEELGVAGAAVVVCLYAGLLLCGWSIISRVRQPFCRLLALGIVLTVGLQSLINMAVVTGLAPTKGIALPLVSAGGTGWVMTAFAIGLLASIDRSAQNCQADVARLTHQMAMGDG